MIECIAIKGLFVKVSEIEAVADNTVDPFKSIIQMKSGKHLYCYETKEAIVGLLKWVEVKDVH